MKKPGLLLSFVPVIILVAIIIVSIFVYKGEITSGPAQIALISAAVTGALIAMMKLKVPWEKLEQGMLENLSNAGVAIFILLMIGALTASWIQSGVVPSLVYYGLELINPSVFLIVIFVFTAIISLMIGSSWTTIGTIGVAMISAGHVLGFHSGWLAGAIISGAYFGDKVSPLSDTTNLASSIAGARLYDHVKYMMVTNIPAIIITAAIFTIAGFTIHANSNIDVASQLAAIKGTYHISPWLLLIPFFTIFLIIKKVSPFLTLFLSAVLAAIIACFVQPQITAQISPFALNDWKTYFYVPVKVISSHVDIAAGNAMLTKLASTNGIAGMLNTIWIILCVTAFGGIMEASGFIRKITEKMEVFMKNTVSLVSTTIGTCIFCNITLADQYMAIIVPGKMLKKLYEEKGYEGRLLSRSLEDSATVTSVLVPWNTCGVMQSSVLGVPTLVYAPYCFFNIISPIISIICAAIGFRIFKFNKPLMKWHCGISIAERDAKEAAAEATKISVGRDKKIK